MIQRKFVNNNHRSDKQNRYIRLYTHPSYGIHETFHPLLFNHLFINGFLLCQRPINYITQPATRIISNSNE